MLIGTKIFYIDSNCRLKLGVVTSIPKQIHYEKKEKDDSVTVIDFFNNFYTISWDIHNQLDSWDVGSSLTTYSGSDFCKIYAKSQNILKQIYEAHVHNVSLEESGEDNCKH